VASKKDNKLKVTYNIDPANLHPDFFVLISEKIVPKKVYELFKQKVYADIARLDSMMYNIVQNKSMLSTLTKFVDENIINGTDVLSELEVYTQADAEADQKMEHAKMMNQKTMRRSPQAQKKALRKAKEKSKKINRKKK
jgi:glutamate synthase domain-containing protein 2